MLPSLVRAGWRLWQARRALLCGAPQDALRLLADPSLTLSRRADWLRERTLVELCRNAAERARDGRDGSAARILDVVEAEDPALAQRQRARLAGAEERPEGADQAARRALRSVLDELRSELRGEAQRGEVVAPEARESSPKSAASGEPRLRLSIDDAGELLVVRARPLLLGHRRSGRAELGFLADVEPEHARLVPEHGLHEGPRWRIEPAAGEVQVDGAPLSGPAHLADGARVRLARNLSFRFRFPDPASASALLELEGGIECHGATRVLLLVPGRAGVARVGRAPSCHFLAPALEHELSLWLEEQALVLRCAAGLAQPSERSSAPARTELRLPLPLGAPYALELGARRPGAPPAGLVLRSEGEGER